MLRSVLAAAVALSSVSPAAAQGRAVLSRPGVSKTPSVALPLSAASIAAPASLAAPSASLVPALTATLPVAAESSPEAAASAAPAAAANEIGAEAASIEGAIRFDGSLAHERRELGVAVSAAPIAAPRGRLLASSPAAPAPSRRSPVALYGFLGAMPAAGLASFWWWGVALVAGTGVLALDLWTGGGVRRKLVDGWRSRRGYVEAGVRTNTELLYDLREADRVRLGNFLAEWGKAKPAQKQALVLEAAEDEALWREKLTAAFMSTSAPELQAKLLAELKRGSRRSHEPIAPVVSRMSGLRGKLPWLEHADAEFRLRALEGAAGGKTAPAPAPERASKAWRWGSLGLFALMTSLTAASGTARLEQREQARAVADYNLKQFYGDDSFLFTDKYMDERIARFAVPALEKWYADPKEAGPELERALEILRSSPDPKADNLLVAVFRRAGALPLTDNAETLLLKALVERDSDPLWERVDELVAESGSNGGARRMTLKLAELGPKVAGEKALGQLFRLLKSRDAEIQDKAFDSLYSRLAEDPKKYYPLLQSIQYKYSKDPMMQTWSSVFTMRRLADPAATDGETDQARRVLDSAFSFAINLDRSIVSNFVQAKGKAQLPEGGMLSFLLQATRETTDLKSPRAAAAARYLAGRAAEYSVSYGGEPGRLAREKVSEGGVMRGFSRWEFSRLNQLKALGEAFAAAGNETAGKNANAAASAGVWLPVLEQAYLLAKEAGMREGGTPEDLAAQDMRARLEALNYTFGGGYGTTDKFLKTLQEKGLAPAYPFTRAQAYPETLDAAQLAALRELLLDVVKKNEAVDYNGKPRPLRWSDREVLAPAIDLAEKTSLKYFPGPAAPTPTPADLDAAFFAALSRPGEEALTFARLYWELGTRVNDGAFALKAQEAALARLAAAPGEKEDFEEAFERLYRAAMATPQEKAFADRLIKELAKEGAARDILKTRLVYETPKLAETLVNNAERQNSGLRERVQAAGARGGRWAYWRDDMTLRHYSAARRAVLNQANAAGTKADRKAELRKTAASLATLRTLAAAVGVRAGDKPAEIAAEIASDALNKAEDALGYSGESELRKGMAEAKLKERGLYSNYKKEMEKAELEAARAWLRAFLAKDKVSEERYKDGKYQTVERPLSDAEKAALRAAASELTRAIGVVAPAKMTKTPPAVGPTGR